MDNNQNADADFNSEIQPDRGAIRGFLRTIRTLDRSPAVSRRQRCVSHTYYQCSPVFAEFRQTVLRYYMSANKHLWRIRVRRLFFGDRTRKDGMIPFA